MRTTFAGVRALIREALEGQELVDHLTKASKRPYLVGQWVETRRGPEHRGQESDCWEAEDSAVGKVYLTVSSSTSYGMDGRLRDVSKTRYVWKAVLSVRPFVSFSGPGAVDAVKATATGEGKEREKADQFRRSVMKRFGIDPMPYRGPLDPVA